MSCIQKIREDFYVTQVESIPSLDGPGIIVFSKGEMKKAKKTVVINRLVFESRRIVLEVAGTSKESNQVYDAVLSSIDTVAGIDSSQLREPIITSDTAQCIVTLDFDFQSLFRDSLVEFMNNRVKRQATSKIVKALVVPRAAEFEISYEITDDAVSKNRVTFSPKRLVIAPREGMPREARRYFISSPFDSDTHLKLIRELEAEISKTN